MVTKGYPTVTHNTPKIWPSVIAAMLLLAAPAAAQNYTIMPQPYGIVQDDANNTVVGGCVWTYAAGTTTAIATYSNTSGTQNSNPIVADGTGRFTAFLLAGTNYKFVYENTPCAVSPPTHGPVLRTADNIAGTPSTAATVDITCTAGEAISAGQAAYLSTGAGGKQNGQCYKGDSANTYSSSSATVFGIAPSAIASGSAGTVRIAGSVPGLSSLSTGSDYYIGSSGALTSTAPGNARKLGAADSTTSMILTLPTGANPDNGIDDFRLTLTSGTPVTTADVTAATTIYASPKTGNRIALFDASGVPTILISAEFSIAVPATTSQMYDVFAFNNAGVATLELLAWTNDTTRATAIVLTTTGTYTKSGDLTRRYLGSFRTTTVSGQTEDSFAKHYLWNYYNRVKRIGRVLPTTDTWTYNTNTFRQANADPLNQLDFVIGVAEVSVIVDVAVIASNTNASVPLYVAIGEDSTTTAATGCRINPVMTAVANAFVTPTAHLEKYPAVGRHTYVWLEKSGVTVTTTFRGDDGSPTDEQSGIYGAIEG